MYCPKCSQLQVSEKVLFCSRCGLLLNSVKEAILAESKTKASQPETSEGKLSPRQKGLRQGTALILLSVVLIPAYVLLAALFPADDRLIEGSVSHTPFEKISQAVLFTIFMVGVARVFYARFFQQDTQDVETEIQAAQLNGLAASRLSGSSANYALPPTQSIPVSGFNSWSRDTGEMAQTPGKFGNRIRLVVEMLGFVCAVLALHVWSAESVLPEERAG